MSCGIRPIRRSSDAEILAVHVLHRQEAAAVRVAEVVEPADVLVRDLARDAQLVVELRQPRVVGGDARREELQRDRLIEREIVGAVHLAHAAAAEQRDEAVAAGDNGAGRETSGRGSGRRGDNTQRQRAGQPIESSHHRRAGAGIAVGESLSTAGTGTTDVFPTCMGPA